MNIELRRQQFVLHDHKTCVGFTIDRSHHRHPPPLPPDCPITHHVPSTCKQFMCLARTISELKPLSASASCALYMAPGCLVPCTWHVTVPYSTVTWLPDIYNCASCKCARHIIQLGCCQTHGKRLVVRPTFPMCQVHVSAWYLPWSRFVWFMDTRLLVYMSSHISYTDQLQKHFKLVNLQPFVHNLTSLPTNTILVMSEKRSCTRH